jgi:aminomethyltransferase
MLIYLKMEYYTFAVGQFNGIDNVVISNTGYTGAGGFEIYLEMKMQKKCGMHF